MWARWRLDRLREQLGRCAKTALGRVTAIFERPDRVYRDGAYVETMVPSVQVDSLQDDVGFRKDRMKVKRVTLRETERVLKYEAKLVSSKVKRLFEEVK